MWFARAVVTNVIDTNGLAEIMQRNCTVKKSDILAVLSELVETMTDQLQQSARVKLDGFGSFKIGIKGIASATVKDYSVSKNVKGLRVNFLPESSTDAAGNRTKQFLNGATVQEAPKNAVVDETTVNP
jgi:predicted histone-like DNA-binding protein